MRFENMIPIEISDVVDLTIDHRTIDLTLDMPIDLSRDEPAYSYSRQSIHTKAEPTVLATWNQVEPSPSVPFEIMDHIPQKRRPGPGRSPHSRGPPAKKQRQDNNNTMTANSAFILRSSSTPTHTHGPRRLSKHIFFELDSDGEEIDYKHKKIKQCDSTDSDDESDYSAYHAGLDLSDPYIWKISEADPNKLESELLDSIQHLTVSSTVPPPKSYHPDISDRSRTKSSSRHPSFVWEALRTLGSPPRHSKPYQSSLASILGRPRRPETSSRLQLTASFKNAPGAINKIVQQGAWIAICSASVGGQPDEHGEEEDPYNREGALMVWNNALQTLPGHFRKWDQYVKHYTVNDVKFDPCSSSLASSGNDKMVKIWERDPLNNTYRIAHRWTCDYIPHDLAFKPGESILAVAERKLFLYSDISSDHEPTSFSLTPRRADHSVGAIAWGYGETSTYLFASSEPRDGGCMGSHKAFDVAHQQMAYRFDADEAGDAIGVTQDGTNLALLTCGTDRHTLQLYDIGRHNHRAVRLTELAPFPNNIEGEVNCATFSPDGIYLALARNDNHTHVYDSRMLDRILFDFEHHGPCRISPGSESYGVVQAQWVERNFTKLGLVTGGNDGCVRLWDPLRSAEDQRNGTILAETNSDVACFSSGDPFKGEHELVVGDCAGEISIFDRGYSNL